MFVNWDTVPRAVLNVMLFGLAALSGEWLVHQVAYLIEYRRQFSAVMESTPHRYYMAPAGIFLAAGVLGVLGSTLLRGIIHATTNRGGNGRLHLAPGGRLGFSSSPFQPAALHH